MKLCAVILGVLAACAVTYAVEQGPLLTALQPRPEEPQLQEVAAVPQARPKRGLLLAGAGLAGLAGLGVLGAGAVGLGAAGLVGAKAGLIGGALASKAFHGYGRSYGGYGGYGGYGYGGYHSYVPSYYRSYSPSYVSYSYPSYVEHEWY